MAIHVPQGKWVNPADLAGLEQYMWNRPGDWIVFAATPAEGKYVLMQDLGDSIAFVTCILDVEPVFNLNRRQEIDSMGEKKGKDRVVARIPMALLYDDAAGAIGKRLDDGDKKSLRRVLNDGDLSKFKTVSGTI